MPVVSRASPGQAEEISRRHYGIGGAATRPDAEADDAFRLTAADGTARLLKISVLGGAGSVGNGSTVGGDGPSLQTVVLLHLAATAPGLPAQRIIAAQDGRKFRLMPAVCLGSPA